MFYKFVIKNCGTVDLYNVRLDDCIDQRSVGDSGFLVGGATGRCVENPRLIPASPQRIVAQKLRAGPVGHGDERNAVVLEATRSAPSISAKQFGGNRVNGIVRNDSEVEAEADVDGNGVGRDLHLHGRPEPGALQGHRA